MPIPTSDHNKVLSVKTTTLAATPLIGELSLTTEKGEIIVGINEDSTMAMIEELVNFLDPE